MSKIFFTDFGLPTPNVDLGVGSGSACFQIGEMTKRLELDGKSIDLVLVYGYTNSTLAGANVRQ